MPGSHFAEDRLAPGELAGLGDVQQRGQLGLREPLEQGHSPEFFKRVGIVFCHENEE